MNLHHLSSLLRLDMTHLAWVAQANHLSSQQLEQRFNYLAHGYCESASEEDLSAVKALVHHYQSRLHIH